MEPITTGTIYAFGVPIILAMIALEALYSSVRNTGYYQQADALGTAGLLAGNIVVAALSKGSVFLFSLYLYQFRLLDLNSLLPSWVIWVLVFFAIDFVFYWYHRASHRVRALWAVHLSHHCSEEMNFAVAFRQAWLGPISKIPFFAILPLVGFDPTITIVAGVASQLWGVVGHTRTVGKLGPLEWVFNTPSHHRVHHGSNPEYLDKNYGNLFIIWDRMFGTFEEEQAAVKFGLVHNVGTQNPIKITLLEWNAMLSDVRRANSVPQMFQMIFGPPGSQSAHAALRVSEKRASSPDVASVK